eukprot:m.33632 g.33632  ORF g.33632 m.33632 type:complete len:806 (+) comp16849_c0_seq3:36-2453(+)
MVDRGIILGVSFGLAAYILTLIPNLLIAASLSETWAILRPLAWMLLVVGFWFMPSRNSKPDTDKVDVPNPVEKVATETTTSSGGCCQDSTPSSGCCQDKSGTDDKPDSACCQTSTGSGGDCCKDNTNNESGCCSDDAKKESSGGCCKDDSKKESSGGCCSDDSKKESSGGCCSDDPKKASTSGGCGSKTKTKAKSTYRKDTTIASGDTTLKVFYGTQTNTSKGFAEKLVKEAQGRKVIAELIDLETYEPETLIDETAVCVFFISTYEGGVPPKGASWFHKWVDDTRNDFRMPKRLMRDLRFTVFGLGNSLYASAGNFNKVAVEIEGWLLEMGGTRAADAGCGDENVAESVAGGQEADYVAWKRKFWVAARVEPMPEGGSKIFEGVKDAVDSESENEEESEDDNDGEIDMEDLGAVMNKAKLHAEKQTGEPREMITPALRSALSKQGYRLIGSHSGVKLCRWTKSMMRGRGGCYKHAFYGIESHRCMETTPSLACANKCVFCWRHHTNPVGTEWRWKMDSPELVVNGAMENHYDMIKGFKGVPGVLPERFKEANHIKHCALSLVGEPIMYPQINEFLDILHSRKISSFLVTNAQFPECITNLRPLTQLYVSIDASNAESLKKIDRPLFQDYWPRFLKCLTALEKKGQRTVYRLTIVKAWNDDETQNYAALVGQGNPDFIEVKGVTFCGESKASTLTMGNVPWHKEVVDFVQSLTDLLPDYEIASEHEHSNCLLIAHKKFHIDGRWNTWIDYDRFHELLASKKPFTSMDYMAPTPEWAVFGSPERGFDPVETRVYRKPTKDKSLGGC